MTGISTETEGDGTTATLAFPVGVLDEGALAREHAIEHPSWQAQPLTYQLSTPVLQQQSQPAFPGPDLQVFNVVPAEVKPAEVAAPAQAASTVPFGGHLHEMTHQQVDLAQAQQLCDVLPATDLPNEPPKQLAQHHTKLVQPPPIQQEHCAMMPVLPVLPMLPRLSCQQHAKQELQHLAEKAMQQAVHQKPQQPHPLMVQLAHSGLQNLADQAQPHHAMPELSWVAVHQLVEQSRLQLQLPVDPAFKSPQQLASPPPAWSQQLTGTVVSPQLDDAPAIVSRLCAAAHKQHGTYQQAGQGHAGDTQPTLQPLASLQASASHEHQHIAQLPQQTHELQFATVAGEPEALQLFSSDSSNSKDEQPARRAAQDTGTGLPLCSCPWPAETASKPRVQHIDPDGENNKVDPTTSASHATSSCGTKRPLPEPAQAPPKGIRGRKASASHNASAGRQQPSVSVAMPLPAALASVHLTAARPSCPGASTSRSNDASGCDLLRCVDTDVAGSGASVAAHQHAMLLPLLAHLQQQQQQLQQRQQPEQEQQQQQQQPALQPSPKVQQPQPAPFTCSSPSQPMQQVSVSQQQLVLSSSLPQQQLVPPSQLQGVLPQQPALQLATQLASLLALSPAEQSTTPEMQLAQQLAVQLQSLLSAQQLPATPPTAQAKQSTLNLGSAPATSLQAAQPASQGTHQGLQTAVSAARSQPLPAVPQLQLAAQLAAQLASLLAVQSSQQQQQQQQEGEQQPPMATISNDGGSFDDHCGDDNDATGSMSPSDTLDDSTKEPAAGQQLHCSTFYKLWSGPVLKSDELLWHIMVLSGCSGWQQATCRLPSLQHEQDEVVWRSEFFRRLALLFAHISGATHASSGDAHNSYFNALTQTPICDKPVYCYQGWRRHALGTAQIAAAKASGLSTLLANALDSEHPVAMFEAVRGSWTPATILEQCTQLISAGYSQLADAERLASLAADLFHAGVTIRSSPDVALDPKGAGAQASAHTWSCHSITASSGQLEALVLHCELQPHASNRLLVRIGGELMPEVSLAGRRIAPTFLRTGPLVCAADAVQLLRDLVRARPCQGYLASKLEPLLQQRKGTGGHMANCCTSPLRIALINAPPASTEGGGSAARPAAPLRHVDAYVSTGCTGLVEGSVNRHRCDTCHIWAGRVNAQVSQFNRRRQAAAAVLAEAQGTEGRKVHADVSRTEGEGVLAVARAQTARLFELAEQQRKRLQAMQPGQQFKTLDFLKTPEVQAGILAIKEMRTQMQHIISARGLPVPQPAAPPAVVAAPSAVAAEPSAVTAPPSAVAAPPSVVAAQVAPPAAAAALSQHPLAALQAFASRMVALHGNKVPAGAAPCSMAVSGVTPTLASQARLATAASAASQGRLATAGGFPIAAAATAAIAGSPAATVGAADSSAATAASLPAATPPLATMPVVMAAESPQKPPLSTPKAADTAAATAASEQAFMSCFTEALKTVLALQAATHTGKPAASPTEELAAGQCAAAAAFSAAAAAGYPGAAMPGAAAVAHAAGPPNPAWSYVAGGDGTSHAAAATQQMLSTMSSKVVATVFQNTLSHGPSAALMAAFSAGLAAGPVPLLGRAFDVAVAVSNVAAARAAAKAGLAVPGVAALLPDSGARAAGRGAPLSAGPLTAAPVPAHTALKGGQLASGALPAAPGTHSLTDTSSSSSLPLLVPPWAKVIKHRAMLIKCRQCGACMANPKCPVLRCVPCCAERRIRVAGDVDDIAWNAVCTVPKHRDRASIAKRTVAVDDALPLPTSKRQRKGAASAGEVPVNDPAVMNNAIPVATSAIVAETDRSTQACVDNSTSSSHNDGGGGMAHPKASRETAVSMRACQALRAEAEQRLDTVVSNSTAAHEVMRTAMGAATVQLVPGAAAAGQQQPPGTTRASVVTTAVLPDIPLQAANTPMPTATQQAGPSPVPATATVATSTAAAVEAGVAALSTAASAPGRQQVQALFLQRIQQGFQQQVLQVLQQMQQRQQLQRQEQQQQEGGQQQQHLQKDQHQEQPAPRPDKQEQQQQQDTPAAETRDGTASSRELQVFLAAVPYRAEQPQQNGVPAAFFAATGLSTEGMVQHGDMYYIQTQH